jgi:hypothetical protein
MTIINTKHIRVQTNWSFNNQIALVHTLLTHMSLREQHYSQWRKTCTGALNSVRFVGVCSLPPFLSHAAHGASALPLAKKY